MYDAINEKVYINRNVKFNEAVFGLGAHYHLELIDGFYILLPQKMKAQSSTCSISVISENALHTNTSPHSFPMSIPAHVIYLSIFKSNGSDLEITLTAPFISFASSLQPPLSDIIIDNELFQNSTTIVNRTGTNTSTSLDRIVKYMSISWSIISHSMCTPACLLQALCELQCRDS